MLKRGWQGLSVAVYVYKYILESLCVYARGSIHDGV